MAQICKVLEWQARIGECPTWSEVDSQLYWVDIDVSTFNRFDPATGLNRVYTLPAKPGSFALAPAGTIVLAARDGIHALDLDGGGLTLLAPAPFDPTTHRFNDGRCDRQGRFWAGSMGDLGSGAVNRSGRLYRYDARGLLPFHQIEIANGIAFSPDGQTMYRAESLQRRLIACDYDPASGTPGPERLFATVPEELGFPDGATVDAAGGYWVALPGGRERGHLARFTPEGILDVVIPMEVPMPLMPTFGGRDMATLYVTTGRYPQCVDHPGYADSGSIFAVETGYRGVPEALFGSG